MTPMGILKENSACLGYLFRMEIEPEIAKEREKENLEDEERN